jgi:sugar/nucleoside kinase (ribokinase family)
MVKISIVGAAALWDYIFSVEKLPDPGEIVKITKGSLHPYLGGCAPNIAVGLARLGFVDPKLYYPVGQDFNTKGVRTLFKQQGIDCTNVLISNAQESSYALLFTMGDGTTMCFSTEGGIGVGKPDTSNLDDWVIFCPILNEYTSQILSQAIEKKKRVIFTGIASERLVDYLSYIDVLVINRYEAALLSDKLSCQSINEVSSKFNSLTIYLTLGRKGSQVLANGTCIGIPVVKEDVKRDVTGAGDGFTTGVVAGMVLGKKPETCAYIGATISSFIIEQIGGQTNLPTWNQIESRLSQQFPGCLDD